jgi:hypothetical protein
MQPGLCGPDGNVEVVGDLHEGQTDVVVEDEHGALLQRESPERTLQLVTVVHGRDVAVVLRTRRRQHAQLDGPAPLLARIAVALVDDDPMEPRLKAIGVAEGR